MKKKIFYRVFSVSLVAIFLMLVSGVISVNLNTKNVVSARLREETELVALTLRSEEDFARFDKYQNDPKLRITILNLDGNVLYESDTNALLENHKDREEFQNAVAGNPTTVERYSETFKSNMTYYAILTTLDDGSTIVLRLAIWDNHTATYITALIPLFLLVLLVTLLMSFGFATFIDEV